MKKKIFTLALCQNKVTGNRVENIQRAQDLLEIACQKADVIMLPEYFTNNPLNLKNIIAEPIKDYKMNPKCESMRMLSAMAKKHGKYIIGGSIAEEMGDGMIRNTCACFNREGEMMCTYSKIHLFDVNLPGMQITESEFITPGNELVAFETEYCKIGIMICYDMRSIELMMSYARDHDIKMVCCPASFNTVTGPMHWDIVRTGNAMFGQMYFALCSPGRTVGEPDVYPTWGHSSVTDPWGQVVVDAGFNQNIVYHDIDLDVVEQVREKIPTLLKHKHDEIYVNYINPDKQPKI